MFKKKVLASVSLALACCIILSGCVVNKKATVISVNGGEDSISIGYAQFVAKYNQALYEASMASYVSDDYTYDDMWSMSYTDDQTLEEYVKDNVITDIEEKYVTKQKASSLNVKLTKDDKKKINKAVNQFFDDNSNQAAKQMGASKAYVKRYLEEQAIYDKVVETLESQSTDEDYAQDKIDSWVKDAKFKLKKKVWKQVTFDKHFNIVEDN